MGTSVDGKTYGALVHASTQQGAWEMAFHYLQQMVAHTVVPSHTCLYVAVMVPINRGMGHGHDRMSASYITGVRVPRCPTS